MQPDREELEPLSQDSLSGAEIRVEWNDDRRRFTLQEVCGRGQTAVTWRVTDQFDRPFALKFVLRRDYATHSLDAEARRAASISSPLFAKIAFFGEPVIQDSTLPLEAFYAIVVDWVSGPTLREYLADPTTEMHPQLFRRLARDLCEALQSLKERRLTHNDLHDRNILVHPTTDTLSGETTNQLIVIDTGQLKTEGLRAQLLQQWTQHVSSLESVGDQETDGLRQALDTYRRRIAYFSRTDQEWVVFHLCACYNRMRKSLPLFDAPAKRFIRDIPGSLQQMVDEDPSRRMDDPRQMYEEIERVWSQSVEQLSQAMSSPFDLPSAELIRSDRQLLALFSDDYPRLDVCRSNAPVYLYGPRGCGKSTILRSLSLKALLDSQDAADSIAKVPFLGVYISSSQELRSRFLLMSQEDFDLLEGHIIRYFNLLLVEALVDTLDAVFAASSAPSPVFPFHMDHETARHCTGVIRHRLALDEAECRYTGTSHFTGLYQQLRRHRDELWALILQRDSPRMRPDPQLLFDLCRDLEEEWPLVKTRRLVFLIDDYSNQRIPAALQRKLNQTITFSKQSAPIFKVTSEYDGVDLEGIQEGREVNEVNIGFEYVSLERSQRFRFLQTVLERRFQYLGHPVDLTTILPLAQIEPATAMARKIREAVRQRRKFYYHGLDTVADLCSGDFAMGIDLVRRIFEQGRLDWRSPVGVPPRVQDSAIRDFSKQEFQYIRYQSKDGLAKFQIVDRLCWLSKECILNKDTTKDNDVIPVVKNHLDVAERALQALESEPDYAALRERLQDLIRRGILFPLHASRSREQRDATRRYMLRRILLARYSTALGRHLPIRIDDVQRLIFLLTEPAEFAKDELERTSARREANQRQQSLFDDPEGKNA